jgi:hypothetical protein
MLVLTTMLAPPLLFDMRVAVFFTSLLRIQSHWHILLNGAVANDIFQILAGPKGTLTRGELAEAVRGLGFTPGLSELPGALSTVYNSLHACAV